MKLLSTCHPHLSNALTMIINLTINKSRAIDLMINIGVEMVLYLANATKLCHSSSNGHITFLEHLFWEWHTMF